MTKKFDRLIYFFSTTTVKPRHVATGLSLAMLFALLVVYQQNIYAAVLDPTNNALLINFRLSSDTKILLIITD